MHEFITYLEDHPALLAVIVALIPVLGGVAGWVVKYYITKEIVRLQKEIGDLRQQKGTLEQAQKQWVKDEDKLKQEVMDHLETFYKEDVQNLAAFWYAAPVKARSGGPCGCPSSW